MAHSQTKSSLAALSVAAVGIVYGDIGTSPLIQCKRFLLKAWLSFESIEYIRHRFPYFMGLNNYRLSKICHLGLACK